MYKLKKILSELQINNPNNVTPEEASEYYLKNILNNIEHFHDGYLYNFDEDEDEWNDEYDEDEESEAWSEYKRLSEPYIEKYNITDFLGTSNDFEKLSQSELNKFYQDMRKLVRKYVGKERLSELQVTPQNITPEKVKKYYINNILHNQDEFHGEGDGWIEYLQLKDKYDDGFDDSSTLIDNLPQPKLNKFYQDMRALVRKYVGKEILNELQVNNPNKIFKIEGDYIFYIKNKIIYFEGDIEATNGHLYCYYELPDVDNEQIDLDNIELTIEQLLDDGYMEAAILIKDFYNFTKHLKSFNIPYKLDTFTSISKPKIVHLIVELKYENITNYIQ